jgi:hypothetical protein
MVKVGVYDECNIHDKRSIVREYPTNAVTCLMLSHASKKFYTHWHNLNVLEAGKIADPRENWKEYCDIEEHTVDVMQYDQHLPIETIEGTMLGPGYLTHKDVHSVEEYEQVHFIHAHLYQHPYEFLQDWLKLKNKFALQATM